jgi:predicted enzyme related to lactoylglutathione lyase
MARVTVPSEMFFSIEVNDMQRATRFYVDAFGAAVVFASPGWSSLHIAGVRLGLALDPGHTGNRVGLHLVVGDLASARADVEQAGGSIVAPAVEVAPGVLVADVADSEGNRFSLSQR